MSIASCSPAACSSPRERIRTMRLLATTITSLRSTMAAGVLNRRRRILVSQPHPIHRIWQVLLVTTERRQVEVMVGGVHHVEAAREAGIGVEDAALVVAVEH